jgi:hypothetical protein
MSTLTFDHSGSPGGVEHEDDGEGRMPRRPRRRWLTRWSAALLALMMCAIGFYVGVRVEKGHIANSPTTTGGGLAASGRSSAGGSTAGGSGTGASGSAAGAPSAAGFSGRFGGSNATFGTVASVDSRTLTLTEAGGDTVKVTLSSATKITKSKSVKRSQIHPGDTITVSGVTRKQGTVSAATVTDSGAGTTGGSSGSSGSSVRSLFSGG